MRRGGYPLPLVKTKSGEPGSAVVRVGMVSQQRVAFAATTSSGRDSDEPESLIIHGVAS